MTTPVVAPLRLMDLKAVELLTEREFSLDKELRSIGVSNLLSALCADLSFGQRKVRCSVRDHYGKVP